MDFNEICKESGECAKLIVEEYEVFAKQPKVKWLTLGNATRHIKQFLYFIGPDMNSGGYEDEAIDDSDVNEGSYTNFGGVLGKRYHLFVELVDGQVLQMTCRESADSVMLVARALSSINGKGLDHDAIPDYLERLVPLTNASHMGAYPLNKLNEYATRVAKFLCHERFSEIADYSGPICSDVANEVREMTGREIVDAIQTFTSRLDQEALQAAHDACEGWGTISIYNYCRHADQLIQRNRIQAVQVFPALATQLAFQKVFEKNVDRNKLQAVRKAIDLGKPLIQLISLLFDVPTEVVRFFVRNNPGKDWDSQPRWLFHCMEAVHPPHRPVLPEDWASFTEFCNTFYLYRENYCSYKRWLCEIAANGFTKVRNRIEKRYRDPLAIYHALDFLYALTDVLAEDICFSLEVSKVEAEWVAIKVIDQYFVARIGLFRFLDLSSKWHRHVLDMESAPVGSGTEGVKLTWPSPVKQPFCFGDLAIQPLTTPSQLHEESARLHHCVKTYAGKCFFEGAHIFSIRNASGESLSTLELVFENGVNGKIKALEVQHCGDDNSKPAEECLKAVRLFKTFLESAESEVDFARLEKDRLDRQSWDNNFEALMQQGSRSAVRKTIQGKIDYGFLLKQACGGIG